MNEIEFRTWLSKNGMPSKVRSDLVSRLKKLERSLGNCDLEEEYRKDRCSFVLSLFRNKGENGDMARFGDTGLPVGKYHLSVYKYAVQKYLDYLNATLGGG